MLCDNAQYNQFAAVGTLAGPLLNPGGALTFSTTANSGTGIHTVLNTTPSEEYTLTFDYTQSGTATSASVQATGTAASTVSSNGLVTYVFTATSTSTDISILLNGTTGTKTATVDNFKITWETENIIHHDSDGEGYRFAFNGQMKDDEVYGDNNAYTAQYWEYDPRIGRRWNVDPEFGSKPWMSSYHVFSNKPILNIDPNGANDSPVIDEATGELLGTDDEGLAGPAIIMNRNNFKQNMSHDDALSKGTLISDIDPSKYSQEMKDNTMQTLDEIRERPDFDGKLTLAEANNWFNNGNGQPLFVSLEKIEFDGLRADYFDGVGSKGSFNLFNISTTTNDRLVYGSMTFKLLDGNYVRAYADVYNFEIHRPVYDPFNWPRNILNEIGSAVAGEGQQYNIFFTGSKKIRQHYDPIRAK